MQGTDPLAVIAEDAPRVSDKAAIDLVRTRYGLDVAVATLVSERDQNFRLTTTDGARYVLKIGNAAEAPEVTEFQIEALMHIAAAVKQQRLPINTPQILRTLDGSTHVMLESPGGKHVARIVSFLPGIPLAKRIASPALARNMGAYLAHLGRALEGFSHPGSQQSLLWDVQRAPRLRGLLEYVRDDEAAGAVSAALDDFVRYAEPLLPSLRSQVIHSDFNADNVLIDAEDTDVVAGVIDFGDMLTAPLIVDVAIGASYLRSPDENSLRLVSEFVAGYHGITPLTGEEIGILFELIQARVCASVVILDWRASMRGDDDPYLKKLVEGEASARRFLCKLREIPREKAGQVLRQACA